MPLKSFTALGMSQGCSSSLTLREGEDLNDSRSSTTTWRTHIKRAPAVSVLKSKPAVVATRKRMYLTNKHGEGSISLPASSNEANFF